MGQFSARERERDETFTITLAARSTARRPSVTHPAKESHHIVASSSSRADEEEVERRVGALDNGGPRRHLDGDGIASDVFTPQLRTDTRDTDGNVVQRTRGDDASPRR